MDIKDSTNYKESSCAKDPVETSKCKFLQEVHEF